MSSVEEDYDEVMSPEPRKVRKRFKPLKSCAFCRRRKLKCDKKKPKCSSCIRRNLPECLYTENAYTVEMVQSGKVSSLELLERVRDLEKQLADKQIKVVLKAVAQQEASRIRQENSTIRSRPLLLDNGIGANNTLQLSTSDKPLNKGPNPYLSFNYLQAKQYGRMVYYGPTSLRTYLYVNESGFLERYSQLWGKVKEERHKFKSKHDVSLLREVKLIDERNTSGNHSLLQDICDVLPSHRQTTEIVLSFFENDETNELNQILDKNKVMKDFESIFKPGIKLNKDGDPLVGHIIPDTRYNLYKIGVILMILCLKHYFEDIPAPIEKFFVFINGTTSGKTMYIERAQFLVMYCHYRTIYAARGDHTHLLNLLATLAGLSYSLGLHGDIDQLYKKHEDLVGSTISLKKLWVWILYFDYEISFQTGRPLAINYHTRRLAYIEPSNNRYDSYYRRMITFLNIGIPMLRQLYDPDADPPLELFCESLYQFMESEFYSIGNCRNLSLVESYPINDLRILSMTLGTLLCFYILRVTIKKDTSDDLLYDTVHIMSVSLSLTISLHVRCFNIDKVKYKSFFEPNCSILPPYMSLSIGVSNNLFARAASMMTVFLHNRFNTFENDIHLMNSGPNDAYISSGLRRDPGKRVSFIGSFYSCSEAFDNFLNMDKSLMKNTMSKSYIFVIQMALERIYRVITEKVIEFRRTTEQNASNNQEVSKSSPLSNTKDNDSVEPRSESSGSASGNVESPPKTNKYYISNILNANTDQNSYGISHPQKTYNNYTPQSFNSTPSQGLPQGQSFPGTTPTYYFET